MDYKTQKLSSPQRPNFFKRVRILILLLSMLAAFAEAGNQNANLCEGRTVSASSSSSSVNKAVDQNTPNDLNCGECAHIKVD